MWTESIQKKFSLRLKVAGDEGEEKTPEELEAERLAAEKTKNENLEDENDDDDDDDDLDFDSLDDKTKKKIKKLREENKRRRTDYNNLNTKLENMKKGLKSAFGEGGDEKDPEEVLNTLSGAYEQSVSEVAILRLAVENGISGSENLEYFEFLMSKKLNSLEEGEEMDEEDLEGIISKVSTGRGKANTSTKKDGKGGKVPGKNSDEVTQEEFDKMGMIAKSKLYEKNKELYNKLMANSSII